MLQRLCSHANDPTKHSHEHISRPQPPPQTLIHSAFKPRKHILIVQFTYIQLVPAVTLPDSSKLTLSAPSRYITISLSHFLHTSN